MAEMTGAGPLPLIPAGLDRVAAERQSAGLAKLEELSAVVKTASRAPHPVAPSRHPGDVVLRSLALASATAVILFLLVLVGMLIKAAWLSITTDGLNFFTEPLNQLTHPFLPFAGIEGTLMTSGIALVLAAPVGVLIAVFLSEIAHDSVRLPLGFMVEMLAAVPSVVF